MPRDQELRRETRKPFIRMLRYRTESAHGEGHVADVSMHGLRVRCTHLPKTDETVHLELHHDELGIIQIVGIVRWTSESEPDTPTGFGVELMEAPDRYRAALEKRR